MGDDNSSNPPKTKVRTPQCQTADHWIDLEYRYDDLYYTPVADMPFEVTCKRDESIKVRGTTDAGEPYSAHDPDLLTWVHCTEMASFLAGYRRYRRPDLSRAAQDAYFDETRRIAEALGGELEAADLEAVAGSTDDADLDAEFEALV